MSTINREQLVASIPARLIKGVTEEMIDSWVQLFSEEDMAEAYMDNFVSYSRVLNEGKYSPSNYVNAVKYCSHRLNGDTTREAYTKTFPEKVQRWVLNEASAKSISKYVSVFNNSKLVTSIMQQAAVPLWIVNQDKAQEAINTLVELAANSESDKVRCDAANNILVHLKQPEITKLQLDVGIHADDSIASVRKAIEDLTNAQANAITSGVFNARAIAESKVQLEVIEHDPSN